jgi:EmrB/QacA subfamily drug resistance transporter
MQARARAAEAERHPEDGPRSPWLLIVCCVAQFMVILDLSIVNVALPSIQASLGFSASALQWVVDAYAITFAGFLMLGGRAADQFGQRRTFVGAVLVFGLASLIGGVAGSQGVLVGARALQGLGGALMAASSLAIITSTFAPGPARNRAIGLWGAMNGLGGAAGTLFGGLITQELSWRWVLLINPPIGVATALIAFAVIRERRAGHARFDLAGALTLTIGQMVLVYGIVEASVWGWTSPHALGPIFAGLLLLGAFGYIEARVASAPLVPFGELTVPLRRANTIVLLFSSALFPMWFVGSLYLQQVLGLSPLSTGLIFLPMALTIMVCARSAGKFVGRFGVRAVLGGGLIMMTVGMLLFARIASSGSAIVYIMVPGLLTAAGIGFSIVPSTIAATQGAKPGQAGLASGLVNTSRQVGGGLGLALIITLATQMSTHQIGHNASVAQALTDGFRLAYFICAGLVACAALLAFVWIPAPERPGVHGARMVAGVVGVILAFGLVEVVFGDSHGPPIGAYTTKGSYQFVSTPALHPPVIRTQTTAALSRLARGYIFLANFYDITKPPLEGQSGPLILDRSLQPVWFAPVPVDVVASNLSLQSYGGHPALAWWQGRVSSTGATETGKDVVVDQHYRTLATLRGVDGWVLTLHEFLIQGHYAWVTANKNVPMNLSRYGGAYNGALIDSAVQEYDLRNGKLVRSWDALAHIPLADSQATLPTNGFPWDAYHVNAIELASGGGFLVSMRNTWAAYLVNGAGKIQWTLGGRHSSFHLGPDADFQWQHDVQLYPGSLVSMFDDHCCQITGGGTYVSPTGLSRGLVLRLDTTRHTATMVSQFTRADGFDADYMGSLQPQRNGNEFVGWGSIPSFSEYTANGKLLQQARLPGPDLSYRATIEPWDGMPADPPDAAARARGSKTTVYASWNGATRLASWRVQGGLGTGQLHTIASAAKRGFETAVPVRGNYRVFRVQALDAKARVIGTSRTFTAR